MTVTLWNAEVSHLLVTQVRLPGIFHMEPLNSFVSPNSHWQKANKLQATVKRVLKCDEHMSNHPLTLVEMPPADCVLTKL